MGRCWAYLGSREKVRYFFVRNSCNSPFPLLRDSRALWRAWLGGAGSRVGDCKRGEPFYFSILFMNLMPSVCGPALLHKHTNTHTRAHALTRTHRNTSARPGVKLNMVDRISDEKAMLVGATDWWLRCNDVLNNAQRLWGNIKWVGKGHWGLLFGTCWSLHPYFHLRMCLQLVAEMSVCK